MLFIKRIAVLVLAVCLLLGLPGSAGHRASAQGDSPPERVEGAYTPIPFTLWEGGEEEAITAWSLCDALSDVQFRNGDVFYYETFKDEQGELCYRTMDFSTMEISQVKFPQVFGGENALSTRAGEGCCHVLTDSAVYTFDAALALTKRTPWPAALRARMDGWAEEQKTDRAEWIWNSWDVNPSGTAIVFRDTDSVDIIDWDDPQWADLNSWDIEEMLAEKDYGNKFIWVCGLEPEAEPQRILPCITVLGEDYLTREVYGHPHFIDDDRIFVKNWGWEWANFWEVWSLDGRRLYNSFVLDYDEFYGLFPRCQMQDVYGMLMHNPSSLMSPSTFYFDYQTLQLERLPLFSHPPYNAEWLFWAVEGRSCFFAMEAQDASGQAQHIDFFRFDLDTQAVEPLPLTLHGAALMDAALAPGGRIMFVYGSAAEEHLFIFGNPDEEYNAGVFQCP